MWPSRSPWYLSWLRSLASWTTEWGCGRQSRSASCHLPAFVVREARAAGLSWVAPSNITTVLLAAGFLPVWLEVCSTNDAAPARSVSITFAPTAVVIGNTWSRAGVPLADASTAQTASSGPRRSGRSRPNGCGLFGMAGNVWEWTADYFTPRHPDEVEHPCCAPRNPRVREPDPSVEASHPGRSLPPKGHQRRLAPVRSELLPPLSSRGALRRDHRDLHRAHRVPVRRSKQADRLHASGGRGRGEGGGTPRPSVDSCERLPGFVPSRSAVVMSPQSTMTPAIITAMPGAGRGSPSRIAASMARHRRRARAAVTTPARISRTPTVSHAQGSVCPARSRAAATPEATSASAVRSHARYVRSFASWNCASGLRRSLMAAPPLSRCREPTCARTVGE